MRTIHHLTLTTGNVRVSPRHEVDDGVIELLRPILAAGSGVANGLFIEITDRDPIVFTLGWSPDQPSVRCMLCPEPDGGRSWHHALALCSAAGQTYAGAEPPAPWLAVVVLPHILGVTREQTYMLGDAERCVAWALLEPPLS